MSDAPKLFPDSLDGLLRARMDASSALVRTRKRDDEQRLYSYVNRLSDRIDRRVAIDCDDAPVTVACDVKDENTMTASPYWLTIARDEYSDDGLIRTRQGRVIRPHPDELSEARRPDEEDAKLAAVMGTISNVFLCAIAAVLAVLFVGLWLTAWSETGEACPGAPEGWLGYCSAREDR